MRCSDVTIRTADLKPDRRDRFELTPASSVVDKQGTEHAPVKTEGCTACHTPRFGECAAAEILS